MKKIKELKFEELSLEQKLGFVAPGVIIRDDDWDRFEEHMDFIVKLIKNHALGAVWVSPRLKNLKDVMKRIHDAADYPILVFTDAESGLAEYQIGRHNAIGTAGSEELAYIFGKVTAVTARKMGYNIVCDPVLDLCSGWAACGGNSRSMGSDKEKVARLGGAICRGMHDGGVLSVAKHFPGGKRRTKGNNSIAIDGHMAPSNITATKEDLLEYSVYPYTQLIKQGLIDGVMVGHGQYPNIDSEYPASLSIKINNILREQGFDDGFTITDALDMMSVRSKYGDIYSKGLSIAGGNEFCLPWLETAGEVSDIIHQCYNEGIFTEERLNEAVRRILNAQHKVNMLSKDAEITDLDKENFAKIDRTIFAKTDEGTPVGLDKNGKYFFTVIVKNETEINDFGKVTVDTFTNQWYRPDIIMEKLEKDFPNSTVRAIPQFPTAYQNMSVLSDSLGYDDVVFINFAEAPAYTGSDHITHRMVALINALQITDRCHTIVHFGNPYVLSELLHLKRIIIGGISTNSIIAGLEVLSGTLEAKGVLTYDVNFK